MTEVALCRLSKCHFRLPKLSKPTTAGRISPHQWTYHAYRAFHALLFRNKWAVWECGEYGCLTLSSCYVDRLNYPQ